MYTLWIIVETNSIVCFNEKLTLYAVHLLQSSLSQCYYMIESKEGGELWADGCNWAINLWGKCGESPLQCMLWCVCVNILVSPRDWAGHSDTVASMSNIDRDSTSERWFEWDWRFLHLPIAAFIIFNEKTLVLIWPIFSKRSPWLGEMPKSRFRPQGKSYYSILNAWEESETKRQIKFFPI